MRVGGGLKELKARYEYHEFGGGPLLGIAGPASSATARPTPGRSRTPCASPASWPRTASTPRSPRDWPRRRGAGLRVRPRGRSRLIVTFCYNEDTISLSPRVNPGRPTWPRIRSAGPRNRRCGPEASRSREMHDLYRSGGARRQVAPHVVYNDATCPHPGCDQRLQAIDFRLEDRDRSVHDPLVACLVGRYGLRGPMPGLWWLGPFHDPGEARPLGRGGLAIAPPAGRLAYRGDDSLTMHVSGGGNEPGGHQNDVGQTGRSRDHSQSPGRYVPGRDH